MEWWVIKVAVIVLCVSNPCWVIKVSSSPIHHLDRVDYGIYYNDNDHIFTVHLSSIFPSLDFTSASCLPSPLAPGEIKKASLQVRHKHGPCSPLKSSNIILDTLKQDVARVKSIMNRVNIKTMNINLMDDKDVTLPAKDGSIIGSGNYIVTVGLGTPKTDVSLVFDTGSDVTWTQCEPCVVSCYQQEDPIFDPSKSSTYSNISCTSSICRQVTPSLNCSNTPTCLYGIEYGDGSFTVGYFSKDTLHLGSQQVPDFYFGCGQDNEGLFNGVAGLLGLGRDKFSLISQTTSTFSNLFSYCLPSSPSFTGHLTLGQPATLPSSMATQYTSLISNPKYPSFYFIDLQGMTVGGGNLGISPAVFTTAGTIIDSGTVITRLPPAAYSALRDAFRKKMSKYPRVQSPTDLLDTCYDLSRYSRISYPRISLLFGDGSRWDIAESGVLIPLSRNQLCLAFAPNSDASDLVILGNTQQLTFDVIYDVAGGRLGFRPGGCN